MPKAAWFPQLKTHSLKPIVESVTDASQRQVNPWEVKAGHSVRKGQIPQIAIS